MLGLSLVGACAKTNPSTDAGATTSRAPSDGAAAVTNGGLAADGSDSSAVDAGPVDPAARFAGKTVLHVGDSMVGGETGLGRALEAKFTAAGAKVVRETQVSVGIATFDKTSHFKKLLQKHKPDIVVITLGANDVFVPFPSALTTNVESVAKLAGDGRECFWMGPPVWKADTGVVAILRDHASPCAFFDATNLTLPRAGDGIHPTDKGGIAWAEAFWAFALERARGPLNDR